MSSDLTSFAREWEAGWNSHDLDRIMRPYRSDILFRSKKALALVGTGEIIGDEKLRTYWSKALDRQPDLRFTIENVFDGHAMAVITYRNQRNILAAETVYFDTNGLIFQAAACHRADH